MAADDPNSAPEPASAASLRAGRRRPATGVEQERRKEWGRTTGALVRDLARQQKEGV